MAQKIRTAHAARVRRHRRVRQKIAGTLQRPRLCVFRSLEHIYAQVIDDTRGCTLVAATSLDDEVGSPSGAGGKVAVAAKVGALVAQRARGAGVSQVVFDRGGYQFRGRVKALADAAREGGLAF